MRSAVEAHQKKIAARQPVLRDLKAPLSLGPTSYDVTNRALIMGIVNRTPDSFYDKGRYFNLDDSLKLAEDLINDGADIIDVGGVKAGPGDFVSEQEELDRVVPAIEALAKRFDVPLSIDTWRASVADACYSLGAVIGNDISGFGDPNYLKVAAKHGATVVATHIRLQPRVADPEPRYPDDDVVSAVELFLLDRREAALLAGVRPDRIIFDAGCDLGKTAAQSLELLQASDRLATHGPALLLSASNKTFLGAVCGLEINQRRDASLAAAAIGIARGCRILRVHDVAGTKRVVEMLEAILSQ